MMKDTCESLQLELIHVTPLDVSHRKHFFDHLQDERRGKRNIKCAWVVDYNMKMIFLFSVMKQKM